MEKNNGCLNWLGIVAFVIGLYIWVSNVDTIYVTEQLPPPEDSWSVVYPQFRDDVSAQLLNTQQMTAGILAETAYMREQTSDIQNSADLLLNNLGIMKKESYEESIRQRNEQRITTVLSVIFGWFLGAFVTKDSLNKISNGLSQRLKKANWTLGLNRRKRPKTEGPVYRDSGETPTVVFERTVVGEESIELDSSAPELCPICGEPMETKTSPKGRVYTVCPNAQQCRSAKQSGRASEK